MNYYPIDTNTRQATTPAALSYIFVHGRRWERCRSCPKAQAVRSALSTLVSLGAMHRYFPHYNHLYRFIYIVLFIHLTLRIRVEQPRVEDSDADGARKGAAAKCTLIYFLNTDTSINPHTRPWIRFSFTADAGSAAAATPGTSRALGSL